jgi:predicted O-linked N-acetylglucosamine transferase (SPINDLY family)
LPGDRQRQVGPALSRSDLGLPEQAFVFASFNNAYKLNPVMFDTWLRVLRAVPGSVLWLLDENPTATANLRAFAAVRGIATERLVFAPRATVANYRAQLPLADLFLDNHPYNAGSTANDVLWAGTPMLTLSGKTFVSRMGGSLLTALGLPELVTHSHLQYEEQAISLARNPDRLRSLRERLHRARHLSAAFDTGRLARGMESLYVQATQSILGH